MKKLTIKETKFIKHYFETGNGVESVRLAGYKGSYNCLGVKANVLLKKDKIIRAIEKIKKQHGLTDDLLLTKHKQLLEAKRVQSCQIFVTKENGKVVLNKNSDDFIEIEDNPVQLGALKLAYQINNKLNNVLVDQSKHTHYVIKWGGGGKKMSNMQETIGEEELGREEEDISRIEEEVSS